MRDSKDWVMDERSRRRRLQKRNGLPRTKEPKPKAKQPTPGFFDAQTLLVLGLLS